MNKMIFNVEEPPLVKLKKESRQYENIIDLSQAVPDYSMPEKAVEYICKELRSHTQNSISFYSPDPGYFSLREKISEKIEKFNRYKTDPHNIIVTSGANQAFYMAVSALFSSDDKVMLIEPYYFNHDMTLHILGIERVSIKSENIIKPDIEKIREKAGDCNGIVITNPSNPTGYCMKKEELSEILDIAEKNDLYVICDETYEYFDDNFISARSLSDYKKILTICSFSKTYSLTGWRIGYIDADREIIDQMLKIQDCMVICAPSPSQRVLEFILTRIDNDFIIEKKNNLKEKYNICRSFSGKNLNILNYGAFFAYISTPWNSQEAVRKIMKAGVLTVPGNMFERGESGNIRVSLGNASIEDIREAFSILEKI